LALLSTLRPKTLQPTLHLQVLITKNSLSQDFSAKQGCQDSVSNLSDILALHVDYELTGASNTSKALKLNLIIKLLPHDPFSRFFVTEAQFDLREIKFYTQILPDLLAFQKEHLLPGCEPIQVSVPKCFHTHYVSQSLNPDASPLQPPESVLVLEDMRPKGFRSIPFTKGLTLDQAEAAVQSIAAVHALSLGLKVKEQVDINEKYPVSCFKFQAGRRK
jgi:Ecdysteroid kinase-like family